MSLENEIQFWLKSSEFSAFYQKAEYVMALTLEAKPEEWEYLQEHFVEMGRRYNHFIFTVTEKVLLQAKNHQLLEDEFLAKATNQFIFDLEKAIYKEYSFIFSFFLKYREKTKTISNS